MQPDIIGAVICMGTLAIFGLTFLGSSGRKVHI
jgi:hypothetical protein